MSHTIVTIKTKPTKRKRTYTTAKGFTLILHKHTITVVLQSTN